MPGVPGRGGPPPKRSEQRRRRNEPAAGKPRKGARGEPLPPPNADPGWHPVAIRWFDALKVSGQSAWYEASDWATAYLLAEGMSRELSPQPVVDKDGNVTFVSFPPKGASLAAWLRGMTALMVTEGDRRRAAVELSGGGGVEEVADVSSIATWRDRLGAG